MSSSPDEVPVYFPLTILFLPKRNTISRKYRQSILIGFFNPFAEKNGGSAVEVIFSVKFDYKTIALWTLLLIALVVVYIRTIVDIVQSEFKNSSDRVLYLALTLALPFIGTVIYWVVGRSKRINAH